MEEINPNIPKNWILKHKYFPLDPYKYKGEYSKMKNISNISQYFILKILKNIYIYFTRVGISVLANKGTQNMRNLIIIGK